MAIRVKKKTVTLSFKKEKPTAYKLSQVKEQVVTYKTICKNVSANTGIRKGEVEDVLDSLAQQAVQMMEMGHAVQLGTLGTLKPVVTTKCADSKDELNVSDNIVRLKVRFYPGEVFKKLLADMDIETEADDDDDEAETPSTDTEQTPDNGGNDNGGGNSGGGGGGQELS